MKRLDPKYVEPTIHDIRDTPWKVHSIDIAVDPKYRMYIYKDAVKETSETTCYVMVSRTPLGFEVDITDYIRNGNTFALQDDIDKSKYIRVRRIHDTNP